MGLSSLHPVLSLWLAAALLRCGQAAVRIPRGVPDFPHFHAVHHGHGATSYQNVQIENHGSVPIPTEDHHQQHEEPRYLQQDDHHEIVSVTAVPIVDDLQHHVQNLILVAKDDLGASVDAVPIHEHENNLQYITLQQNHEEAAPVDNHENVQYITLEAVPYPHNEEQHVELHDAAQLHYYSDNYEHDSEYDYH